QELGGAAGREQGHAVADQPACELGEPALVCNAEQRPPDHRHGVSVAGPAPRVNRGRPFNRRRPRASPPASNPSPPPTWAQALPPPPAPAPACACACAWTPAHTPAA